jgi:CheY-like chemotaxis protein
MPTADGRAANFAIADVLGKPLRIDELAVAMAPYRRSTPDRATVMVIDDDPLALALMQASLASLGLASACFEDGREALRALSPLRPVAIVLDLMMPGFDGFDVLDALQRIPGGSMAPVYIWTSMILTDDESRSLSRSAQAILGKGGGALAPMMEALRIWRPPSTRPYEEHSA